MRRRPKRNLSPARFRRLLGLVFVGLAVPAAVLIRHAFAQLELDAFRREQLVAEQVYRRVDAELAAAIGIEQARTMDEYRFATAAGAPQRSSLSVYPPAGALPGTIGYFEVDREGRLSTPLLPAPGAGTAGAGLSAAERATRRALESRIAVVLADNRLLSARGPGRTQAAPAASASALETRAREERESASPDALELAQSRAAAPDLARAADLVRGQAVFDELATAAGPARSTPAFRRTAEGMLEEAAVTRERGGAARVDTDSADARAAGEADAAAEAPRADDDDRTAAVSTFELDVEPFRFSRLDAGHFVLFRNAWRDGQRYVQGVLLDADEFLARAVGDAFEQAALAQDTAMAVSAGPDVLTRLEATPAVRTNTAADALYTARLSPPLAELELAFTAGDLPRGPAHTVLVWTTVMLSGVLVGGFLVVYRFGARELELARQQQDFVSAVSHELKTPLTSIRMYGEMLKSGWADEDKKRTYYEFIYAEGERLSRLIDNVLELARLSRGGPAVSLESIRVDEILDMIRSKVATQLEQAGVAITVEADGDSRAAHVAADADALAQVFINLVDNAIKFARDAERREIVLSAKPGGRERITFSVRDFGPGLPSGEMKRLFKLFYRPDDELTRTTSGTGIGLALVRQLVTAMGGSVDVRNRDPGAEFRISLPLAGRVRSSA